MILFIAQFYVQANVGSNGGIQSPETKERRTWGLSIQGDHEQPWYQQLSVRLGAVFYSTHWLDKKV